MDQLRRQDESIGMTVCCSQEVENDKLDFASFCRVAQHFLDEDDEVMQKELKVAFRLYDKEVTSIYVFVVKIITAPRRDKRGFAFEGYKGKGARIKKFLPTETCSSSLAAPIKWMYLLIPGNGYIPTSSLREILMALDDQLTPDQLDEMIAEIDTDGSGTVDFDDTTEKDELEEEFKEIGVRSRYERDEMKKKKNILIQYCIKSMNRLRKKWKELICAAQQSAERQGIKKRKL
uniref:EF-hand domain-containing protein n=1 Tax=Timema tahoe TaxID=61484 RepID=A0A7R9FP28_9NEOP|nr:unnamed protein product [Timema tahoe]